MLKLLVFESLLVLTSVECLLLDSLKFLEILPISIPGTSSLGISLPTIYLCLDSINFYLLCMEVNNSALQMHVMKLPIGMQKHTDVPSWVTSKPRD